jgi:hypothetical protein
MTELLVALGLAACLRDGSGGFIGAIHDAFPGAKISSSCGNCFTSMSLVGLICSVFTVCKF